MKLAFKSLIPSVIIFMLALILKGLVLYSAALGINFFILYIILRYLFEKNKDKILQKFNE